MGINSSIPLQTRVFKPKSGVESYGEAMKLKNLAGQQRLQDMQMTQAETAMGDKTMLRDLVKLNNGDMGAALEQFQGKSSDPVAANKQLNTYNTGQTNSKSAELDLQLKQIGAMDQLINSVVDEPSYQNAINTGIQNGWMKPEDVGTRMPANFDATWVEKTRMETKQGLEQIKFEYKKEQDKLNPGGGTTPSSVAEFEYRMTLPGGIGGKDDKAFLEGKRQLQFLNTGQGHTGVGTAAEGQYVPTDVSTDKLPEHEEAAATAKKTGEKNVEQHDTAENAVANVSKIDSLIAHIDSSEAITGIGAETIKNIERVKVILGGDPSKVEDTELLDVMMGSEVFPLIKTLGLGARGMDTPAEREFLRSVLTGQIQLNKGTLRKMAQLRRDIAQRIVTKWNKRVDDGELDNYFKASGREKQKLGAKEEAQVNPVETPQEVPQTKVINGKTYSFENGEWYEL